MANYVMSHSILTEYDIYIFKSGRHHLLYDKLGSRELVIDGVKGTYFAVYAPAARAVEVIGNFNQWNGRRHQLHVRWDSSGIWEGWIPELKLGELYKYRIYSNYDHHVREKADPYGLAFEQAPRTSTITWDTWYEWRDEDWMAERASYNPYNSPVSIYELHLGSWKKKADQTSLSYREMAVDLADYVKDMGYTHVELLPITEHPFYPSWGYLSTGFFAPTSRYGGPQDFMYLIDTLHQAGIGVILDWVPAHFPADAAWLADFDGSNVYEHPNPKKGYHPDWNSLIFNFERPEVRSFLISSANFWLDRYHIDGLRVDAVASMLYLDYSRKEGEWDPNEYGTNENLGAISFLKELNKSCYTNHPGIMMMAEESTAFDGVTQPVHDGGLGFGYKWMMGWMNDTLRYLERDPIHRKHHYNEISFSMAYAYSENYVLPLSHDEVVHGKKALVSKMPGDEWQRFAQLRLLYAYMYTHPGHKLLFMGNDIGQTAEWDIDHGVQWHLLDHAPHQGVQQLVKDLNHLLLDHPALSEKSFEHHGFQWIDHSDHDNCVLSYLRYSEDQTMLVVCNFTPTAHDRYRLGVPDKSKWREVLNTNQQNYWGSDTHTNPALSKTTDVGCHGFEHTLEISLPPLGVTILEKVESKI